MWLVRLESECGWLRTWFAEEKWSPLLSEFPQRKERSICRSISCFAEGHERGLPNATTSHAANVDLFRPLGGEDVQNVRNPDNITNFLMWIRRSNSKRNIDPDVSLLMERFELI